MTRHRDESRPGMRYKSSRDETTHVNGALLCWGGLGLDNIFFESDALSKLCSVYGFVVI